MNTFFRYLKFRMAMIFPQTKRIKLEHSYAFLIEPSNFEPVAIKQEDKDPLRLYEEGEMVETIKIEIGDHDLVKTEPVEKTTIKEEIVDESNFEYLSVPNANVPKISQDHSDQYGVEIENIRIADVQSIKSEIDTTFTTPYLDNKSIVTSEDPLELVNKNEIKLEKILPEIKKPSEKKKSKNNLRNKEAAGDIQSKAFIRLQKDKDNLKKSKNNLRNKEAAGDIQSKAFIRLQKDKDNFQNQVRKLKGDLKAAKAREKALQTELGARRMSEIYLQANNVELNGQLQEHIKKEKLHSKLMKELSQKLAITELEHKMIRSECTERLKKEHNDKTQTMKLHLKNKEYDLKQLESKCTSLSRTVAALTGRTNNQKTELEKLKQKLITTEQSYTNSVKTNQSIQQRMTEISNELSAARRNNEELQKALLTEKKMSRFFIKERDQLLEEQDSRFKEADKELVKLKQSVKNLTTALNQKMVECNSQKQASKVMMENYHKNTVELRCKVEELEKKEQELAKRTCEYCGF